MPPIKKAPVKSLKDFLKESVTDSEITVERTHNGIRLSTIQGDCAVSRLYIGYSKKEAMSLFKEYLKTICK